MAAIAIVHWDLMKRGGAEAVAANVIAALQDDHDLSLVTLQPPDWDALNAYFDTSLDPIATRRPATTAALLDSVTPALDRAMGARFGVLKESVLCRYAAGIADEFDLLIPTRDECCLGVPSIQYIHFPRYGLLGSDAAVARAEFRTVERSGLRTFYTRSGLRTLYYDLCYAIAGFDPEQFDPTTVLVNSEWTASIVEDRYGVRPAVVHPPVDTAGFEDVPWAERADGFVSVGRISPDKNLLRNIEVIDRLHERGHDVPLHIVGPPSGRSYYERVCDEAGAREYVHMDGSVTRTELRALLSRYKYGLHGKDNEHFGMVVAEFVAAGMIPFVPNDGGQRDIVDHRPELLYDSVEDAVATVDRVLSDATLQAQLRPDVDGFRERFGRDRFRAEIRNAVSEVLP